MPIYIPCFLNLAEEELEVKFKEKRGTKCIGY